MSEITQIQIRNFQAHSNTAIELAPAGGLTVITGGSDQGKTSIIRGLKWLLYNQPQGDGFRRVGCDFVEVEMETAAGDLVLRRRTSTTNRYIANTEVFEGFGNTVPLEVQQITGVRAVRLGDQEIIANLAGQLDAPFLGNSISGPARAKVLGKLAGTEVIDRAARDLNGDVYRVRQTATRLEQEQEDLTDRIARYDHLPKLAERIQKLREILTRITADQERLAKLRPLEQTLEGNARSRDIALATLSRWQVLPDAEAAFERFQEHVGRVNRLANAESKLLITRELITKHHRTLDRLKSLEEAGRLTAELDSNANRYRRLIALRQKLLLQKMDMETAERRLCSADRAVRLTDSRDNISTLLQRMRQLKDASSKLEGLRQRQQQGLGTKELAEQTIQTAEEKYAGLLLEIGTCPLCGSPADHDHISEVLAS